jgi:hypothetical protein
MAAYIKHALRSTTVSKIETTIEPRTPKPLEKKRNTARSWVHSPAA